MARWLSSQSDDQQNPSPTSYTVLLMVVFLVVLFLIVLMALYWANLLNGVRRDASQQEFKSKTDKITFIDSSVPLMLRDSPYWQKVFLSLAQYHPWLCLLFPAPHTTPPLLTAISLFSKICLIYFLTSLVYDYAEEGYSSCSSHGRESCEEVNSFLNVGQSMCRWNSEKGDCHGRDQNDNIMRLLFISVLVGTVHTPIWLLLERLMIARLVGSSDLLTLHSKFPIAKEDEEVGFSLQNDFSSSKATSTTSADFAELIRVVHHTAEKVADSDQRYLFMKSWKLFEENNPIFQRLRITQQIYKSQLPLLHSPRLSNLEKSQILISLFVGDLLPSIDYLVFWNQYQRHHFIEHPLPRSIQLGLWASLALIDTLMLLYTIRFWWRHSFSTQFAFMTSFFYWLLLDVFLFQGTFFIWNYLILPSRAMPSITAAKEFAVGYILNKSSPPSHCQPMMKFNAAHYIFASYQLAQASPLGIGERDTILSYRSVIPPECNRDMTQFDRFIEYFVSMDLLVHDISILTVWTLVSGGLIVLEIFLFRLNPFFVLFPFQALVVILIFLLVFAAFRSVQISPETISRYQIDLQEEPPQATLPIPLQQLKDQGSFSSSRRKLQPEEEEKKDNAASTPPSQRKKRLPPPTMQMPSSPHLHQGILPAIHAVNFTTPTRRGRQRTQNNSSPSPASPLPPLQSYNSIKNIYSQRSEPFIEDQVTSGAAGPSTPEVAKSAARSVRGSLILADE